jgi:transposase InsO family protein/transposase-like protein
MLKRGKNLRQTIPRFSATGYYAFMVSFRNLSGFEENDIAQFRFKALEHCYTFGWKAAMAAFGVKKSTLFDWRRLYEQSGRKLNSLVPKSTRPHQTRRMATNAQLLAFIKSMREEHGNVGKMKLKPFLDAYARSLGLTTYGFDKIGLIIKRNHYFFDKPKRRKTRKLLQPRLKHAPNQSQPGYIEMDSITLYVLNRKLYFITAIDVVTRLAWCKLVPSLSSVQARQALEEFRAYCPYPIWEIQTDNGHEFLKEFDVYLQGQDIPHQFIYPRSPRINGTVERFNRTIQDEFLSRCDELYTQEWDKFQTKLSRYLIWYNTQRPHYSLKYQTPMAYLQQFTT